jgi:hypothetical protein
VSAYQFKAGSRFRGDADAVVGELERIRSATGSIRAETVLESAAGEASPLHVYFEWDDARAAHEQRLETARRLIRAVVSAVPPGTDEVSKYVYTEREYVPLATIAADPGRYLQALAAARRDLESAERRVADLLNAAKVEGRSRKGDVARIMLAAQALQTAHEALRPLS